MMTQTWEPDFTHFIRPATTSDYNRVSNLAARAGYPGCTPQRLRQMEKDAVCLVSIDKDVMRHASSGPYDALRGAILYEHLRDALRISHILIDLAAPDYYETLESLVDRLIATTSVGRGAAEIRVLLHPKAEIITRYFARLGFRFLEKQPKAFEDDDGRPIDGNWFRWKMNTPVKRPLDDRKVRSFFG